MLGIYYTNAWDAKSQPFMSTRLRTEGGASYPTAKVFVGGVLDHAALDKYGIPQLTGTFAYAMFMANAAVRIRRNLLFGKLLTSEPDWCLDCSLCPVLGRRFRQGVQKRQSRTLRRPSPCSHGQTLQGGPLVVVCCGSRLQLYPGPRGRHQGEPDAPGVGVCCCPAGGNRHCPPCESPHVAWSAPCADQTCRALFCWLALATALLQTTCPRCWQVS